PDLSLIGQESLIEEAFEFSQRVRGAQSDQIELRLPATLRAVRNRGHAQGRFRRFSACAPQPLRGNLDLQTTPSHHRAPGFDREQFAADFTYLHLVSRL